MGHWNINIQGIGPHHNTNATPEAREADAEVIAQQVVNALRDAGHQITSAQFSEVGGHEVEDLIVAGEAITADADAPEPDGSEAPVPGGTAETVVGGGTTPETDAPEPDGSEAPVPGGTTETVVGGGTTPETDAPESTPEAGTQSEPELSLGGDQPDGKTDD